MEDVSRSQMLDQIHSSARVLNSLRNDLKAELEQQNKDGGARGESLQSLVEKVEEAIGDKDVLLVFYEYLQIEEAKVEIIKAKAKRVANENRWLCKEIASLHSQFSESQARIVVLEEEVKKLRFENEMSKIDVSDIKTGHEKDEREGNVKNSSQTWHRIMNSYEIPARIQTLHNLVTRYAREGRYEVAVVLCKQALEDLERSSGRDHPDFATMLNILALVYRDQGRFNDATALLNEALNIRKRQLGADHPAVAATLNNLGVIYGKYEKYQEAEPLCKRALEIREKVLGDDHPDVAKQLNNLGLLCQKQGRYDEAERYHQRALNIYTICLGPNNRSVTKTKTLLAAVHRMQAKHAETEAVYNGS